MLDFAGTKNQVELGPNKVLEHRADVGGAAGICLNLLRLLQQVVNIRAE
jgi:hypothetical protein